MNGNNLQILIAMVIYMAAVIGIGLVYAKRANRNSEEYFLGGRSLGPWVTAMSAEENLCPVCGGRMAGTRWFAQPGHRYMDLAQCPEHGKFLIRVRLSTQSDDTIRVSRLTYEATSEAAEAYAKRAEKADPETNQRPTHHRRRRRRSKLPPAEG